MDAASVTGVVSQVAPVSDAVELDAMTQLMAYLPASWEGRAMLAITICAVLASIMPPPKEDSPLLWRLLYNIVNALACNFGRARNLHTPPPRRRR
ncbi:MAG: hypothetical protein IJU37_10885 [Desulfovibrio sp.]|nr:hypothetical protein [Desulfovibrio sp.]